METIKPIYQDAIPDMVRLHETYLKRGWNKAAFAAFYDRGEVLAFGAYRDEEMVGYLFSWAIAGECELLNVAVAEEFQRRGVGRALSQQWLDTLQPSDVKQAFLEVAVENKPAMALYRSMGFEMSHRRKDYYGPGEDAICMRLAC